MRILVIGSFEYGFRFYGPFTDEEAENDYEVLEDKHRTEQDFHDGSFFWADLIDQTLAEMRKFENISKDGGAE